MAGRRLSPEERASWARLAQSVRAYRAAPSPLPPEPPPAPALPPPKKLTPSPVLRPLPQPARRPAPVLDDRWEKQIKRGALVPDMAIDLHGHTLSAAHARLDQALATARLRDVRVLLVVTGKPRPAREMGTSGQRGAIRAEIPHWLQCSPHADAIASVRTAHPRHGGEGALYIILRRKK
ncbi:Smr/MutS family protein [Sphingobium algorifonticola]|uniref:DNA mismatch repair protein MutS n=1 Tax=Sphingobium algorifonticola TaxID=2008318 RepID=A0A437J8I6_9SPHN|nr:Smr/MutS family protein [Sphingobium algorifonticola]RVT41808.1 DNA mismatch repair protein MutS [Sphingobium algorifonticola]